ncbi:MAG: nucleotidyltransferase domain-containing protein [Desulfovibrio sp.]|nr:nucleotidyltransferase domain-containing protein [Desulfovibrio sp.]
MSQSVLSRKSAIQRASILGSRALWTARPTSDIDLAVDGCKTYLELGSLLNEFRELPMSFPVDVHSLETINSEELLEHIRIHGKLIFENCIIGN